MFDYVMI